MRWGQVVKIACDTVCRTIRRGWRDHECDQAILLEWTECDGGVFGVFGGFGQFDRRGLRELCDLSVLEMVSCAHVCKVASGGVDCDDKHVC